MIISNIPTRVQILKHKFVNSIGLPFRELLPQATIQEALKAEKIKYRRRLFDTAVRSTGGTPARGCLPFVTLWAFLSQVLDTDKTCHNAVSRVIAWLASADAEIPSEDKHLD